MPLISLSGVSVAFGERTLLDSVNLTVASGARLALVGPNGSGKTTLMRILTGQLAPDSGKVVPEKDTRVSYVPQAGVVHGSLSLREEAESAFARQRGLEQEMRALEERLSRTNGDSPEAESLLWKHHALQEKLAASGYYSREEAIQRVLDGLGFSTSDRARPCSAFSAGWQMRIALARAILENPDIMLLDEPTNYLDLEARTWLEEFLREYPGGLLVVSHDRYFLDVTAASVAEIYMARVSVFTGNYSAYEKARAGELEAIMARYARQQEEIARIEAFIRRFRYNSSKARLVQSRVNYLERLERVEVPPVVKTVHFAFPAPPHSGRLVMAAEGLSKSYGETPVFRGVGFDISRGEKLVVVGVNGAGKSTLLRLLTGVEVPDAGALRLGTGVVVSSYSQETADAWSSDSQVIEEIERVAPTALIPELRTLLGAFLFRGDDIYKSVSVLSGGEKSRLALLMMLLRPANLLVLDEPTNHLDLASKDVLLSALKSFSGTVVFVSHDRHFIANLATAVLELKDGAARYFPGEYEYYLRQSSAESTALEKSAESASADKGPSASQVGRQEDKKLKGALRALERAEEAVMTELEALEAKRVEVESSMSRPATYSDGEAMRRLTKEHGEIHTRHEEATARWDDLARKIAELKGRAAGPR